MSGGDWPGTLGVRRSVLMRTGGHDGTAVFENLELVRTVCAAGGRELIPLYLYVARRPSTARHFLSQRVRQALTTAILMDRRARTTHAVSRQLGHRRQRNRNAKRNEGVHHPEHHQRRGLGRTRRDRIRRQDSQAPARSSWRRMTPRRVRRRLRSHTPPPRPPREGRAST
jgi:hypothetical protein